MGFAWKTDGETGNVWAAGDYWYGPEADPNYTTKLVLVTDSGIKTATKRTIDGDLSDWGELTQSTTSTRAALATHLGVDGLYIAVKMTQADITGDRNYTEGDCWKNQNLEFQATDTMYAARVIMYNGQCYHTGGITDAAMTFVQNADGDDEWIVEMFIANEAMKNVDSSTASVTMKLGGQLFASTDAADANVWNWYAENVPVNRT